MDSIWGKIFQKVPKKLNLICCTPVTIYVAFTFVYDYLQVTCIGFPGGSTVKNLPAMQEMRETRLQFLGWEDPLEEGMATHASILAGKFHGQRSLAGYCPWARKESDMTE